MMIYRRCLVYPTSNSFTLY